MVVLSCSRSHTQEKTLSDSFIPHTEEGGGHNVLLPMNIFRGISCHLCNKMYVSKTIFVSTIICRQTYAPRWRVERLLSRQGCRSSCKTTNGPDIKGLRVNCLLSCCTESPVERTAARRETPSTEHHMRHMPSTSPGVEFFSKVALSASKPGECLLEVQPESQPPPPPKNKTIKGKAQRMEGCNSTTGGGGAGW